MTLARRSVTSDHLHVLFPNVRLSVNDTIILASNLSSSTYRDFINYTSRFVYDVNHTYCHVGRGGRQSVAATLSLSLSSSRFHYHDTTGYGFFMDTKLVWISTSDGSGRAAKFGGARTSAY